jgi:hypothetical protein
MDSFVGATLLQGKGKESSGPEGDARCHSAKAIALKLTAPAIAVRPREHATCRPLRSPGIRRLYKASQALSSALNKPRLQTDSDSFNLSQTDFKLTTGHSTAATATPTHHEGMHTAHTPILAIHDHPICDLSPPKDRVRFD